MASFFTPPNVFKSLADDTRAKIMMLVAQEQELCVCELTSALDMSQPKISRHLAVLRNYGLLADRRQGQWVYYRLHPELPHWVREVISTTYKANKKWLTESVGRLAAMGDRPVRGAACC
jgi:ArsR family transcriptional regulator, arsenate/arsenite/antimonite-responsive transcriptional repressor